MIIIDEVSVNFTFDCSFSSRLLSSIFSRKFHIRWLQKVVQGIYEFFLGFVCEIRSVLVSYNGCRSSTNNITYSQVHKQLCALITIVFLYFQIHWKENVATLPSQHGPVRSFASATYCLTHESSRFLHTCWLMKRTTPVDCFE